MKLLLDECVTRDLIPDLAGHEVHTIERAGLKGLKNGELLKAATGVYEVLVTVDQKIPYQQNLVGLSIAILILAAKRNSYLSEAARTAPWPHWRTSKREMSFGSKRSPEPR